MQSKFLNNGWKLHEAPLSFGKEDLEKVKSYEQGWLNCDLPVDVRMPLIKHGLIKDPVKSDYCLESEWIEQHSWWFFKTFSLHKTDLENDIIEVIFDRLDTNSHIFINNIYIGSHYDIHFPFSKNIKDYLHEGINEISVCITTGLEEVTDKQLSKINGAVCTEYDNGGKYRGDKRRAFVRRPQYTVGWDWGPRVVTCGITGDVSLKFYKHIAIREVSVTTQSTDSSACLSFSINIENLDIIGTKNCNIYIEISLNDTLCTHETKRNVLLTSGYNYIKSELYIPNPQLWWPNGYGAQPLYKINVYAECDNFIEQYPVFSYGIRTLSLDTSLLDNHNRRFTFVVNGVPIFAKGGNWIPNDSIYARTTEQKVETLLKEAIHANFNCLRIWGGGLYETDHFYSTCDKLGILIWHDFMFACSTYPDYSEAFCNLVFKELDYQTKRLRVHPSIALFCGTNENHWLFNKIDTPKWNIEISQSHPYGLSIPNTMAKEIIEKNCPQIPYWNSSPYGGILPNDDTIGDVHRWRDAFMSDKMEERLDLLAFDKISSKFVSEYGFIGPCCADSTREYLDLKNNAPVIRSGRPWEMHLNVFEKETICAGIEKYYTDNARSLSLDDYILYGGMVHSKFLEYSLESIRFKEFCSGGLFWMYNDTWGEAGWSIIDYYLKRKPAFYGVKRALAHRKVSIRVKDNKLIIQGINDCAEPFDFKAEYGYISFDGKIRQTKFLNFHLEPHCRKYLLSEKFETFDLKKGCIAVIPDSLEIEPVSLFAYENRHLQYEKSNIEVIKMDESGEDTNLTLTSSGYVHGVYIKGNHKCSDNYFDLLPNQVKTIYIHNPKKEKLYLSQVR